MFFLRYVVPVAVDRHDAAAGCTVATAPCGSSSCYRQLIGRGGTLHVQAALLHGSNAATGNGRRRLFTKVRVP